MNYIFYIFYFKYISYIAFNFKELTQLKEPEKAVLEETTLSEREGDGVIDGECCMVNPDRSKLSEETEDNDTDVTTVVAKYEGCIACVGKYHCANHPVDIESMPCQILQKGNNGEKKKVLSFQSSWFDRFPWLHFCMEHKVILFFHCATANRQSLLKLATKQKDAFVSSGYTNWKKGIEKFLAHEKSACHRFAISQLKQTSAPTVTAQISTQKFVEQMTAWVALVKIIESIRFLARQGLAFRGHEEDDGNLAQLLKLRGSDIKDLDLFMKRTTNFTSHDCQNEMLTIISHDIQRNIIQRIKQESRFLFCNGRHPRYQWV